MLWQREDSLRETAGSHGFDPTDTMAERVVKSTIQQIHTFCVCYAKYFPNELEAKERGQQRGCVRA